MIDDLTKAGKATKIEFHTTYLCEMHYTIPSATLNTYSSLSPTTQEDENILPQTLKFSMVNFSQTMVHSLCVSNFLF